MKIDDIIDKHYDEMYMTLGTDKDMQAYESRLKEDVFMDVSITLLNKYSDKTADYIEDEVVAYWHKTLLMEYLFVKHKKSNKVIYEGSLKMFAGIPDPSSPKI